MKLKGWWFHAPEKRGTVVFLHGVGDNRGSAVGSRLRAARVRGHRLRQPRARRRRAILHVRLSRETGRTSGACSDRVTVNPIVVMGVSMGAAVALQAAAADRRIAAVVAVSSFADLRTAAAERAPVLRDHGSPRHGRSSAQGRSASSAWTTSARWPRPPASRPDRCSSTANMTTKRRPRIRRRSRRAARARTRLILVPNARHSHVLDAGVWREIDGLARRRHGRCRRGHPTAPIQGGAQRAPAGTGAI